MKKTITLIELLIAISLLSVVVLGAIAFVQASRQFLGSSERRVEVLNEATFILEHIHKNILLGIGHRNRLSTALVPNPAVLGSPGADNIFIVIFQDMDLAGNMLNTPENYLDDRHVNYRIESAALGHRELFRTAEHLDWEVLSDKLVSIELSLDANNQLVINNFVLRLNPANAVDARDNPEVRIDAQNFFPLAQSL